MTILTEEVKDGHPIFEWVDDDGTPMKSPLWILQAPGQDEVAAVSGHVDLEVFTFFVALTLEESEGMTNNIINWFEAEHVYVRDHPDEPGNIQFCAVWDDGAEPATVIETGLTVPE